MKSLSKFLKIYILTLILTCLFSAQAILASSNIPFEYNILATESNHTIIDTKVQKKLEFKLYEEMDEIYYNDKLVKIQDNKFSINVSKLTGKNTITFTDKNDNTVSFTYYFSDKKGKVDDYELVSEKNLTTYVTTYKRIKILYSDKEKSTSKKLVSYLKKLPSELLENINSITLIPYDNTSNVAGSAKENQITLYKFSKYSTSTQKNILYHEIAHIWANKLMEKKIIDYSYTNYSGVVNNDNNFVSNYSKSYIEEKEKYNEDFAESVSFYFINKRTFKKEYPYRFKYIENLLKMKDDNNED